VFGHGQHGDHIEKRLLKRQVGVFIQVQGVPADAFFAHGWRQLVDGELIFEGSVRQKIWV